jgi:hypothetical protein
MPTSAVDSSGRTIWIAAAHRGDGKRYVVRANEKLTVFLELESEGERGAAVASSLQQLAADFAG